MAKSEKRLKKGTVSNKDTYMYRYGTRIKMKAE